METGYCYPCTQTNQAARYSGRVSSDSTTLGSQEAIRETVETRLEWWLENGSRLSDSQLGFRKGKGVIDGLVRMIADVQTGKLTGCETSAIFLDIKSVFDNVRFDTLKHRLYRMVQGREIFVRGIAGAWLRRAVSRGLPQGSVLSPILFNIYRDELGREAKGVNIIQYADDVCLYSTRKSARLRELELTLSLNRTVALL